MGLKCLTTAYRKECFTLQPNTHSYSISQGFMQKKLTMYFPKLILHPKVGLGVKSERNHTLCLPCLGSLCTDDGLALTLSWVNAASTPSAEAMNHTDACSGLCVVASHCENQHLTERGLDRTLCVHVFFFFVFFFLLRGEEGRETLCRAL